MALMQKKGQILLLQGLLDYAADDPHMTVLDLELGLELEHHIYI